MRSARHPHASAPTPARRPHAGGASSIAAPAPGLYLVATPIGNLADITRRALDVLAAADIVACEDTRTTAKLLAAHGITARTTAYHEHNAEAAGPRLLARLADGAVVALVSDAGTPLVSDPGARLVRAAIDRGIAVFPVPGPSAVLAALVVAGVPTDRFLFAGFLPARGPARRRAIEALAATPASLVFLEAPHRLAETLADLATVLGPRPAAVARELTKLHEEVRRGTLEALAAAAAGEAARGEIVIVVGPPAADAAPAIDDAEIDRRLAALLATESVRDAANRVAAETGRPRRAVYARALALAGTRP